LNKPTLEQLKTNIADFSFEQPIATLSESYKVANTKQDGFKPSSPEYTALEAFKKKLLSHIRAARKPVEPEPEYEATPGN
jgi:hypothetical protein